MLKFGYSCGNTDLTEVQRSKQNPLQVLPSQIRPNYVMF